MTDRPIMGLFGLPLSLEPLATVLPNENDYPDIQLTEAEASPTTPSDIKAEINNRIASVLPAVGLEGHEWTDSASDREILLLALLIKHYPGLKLRSLLGIRSNTGRKKTSDWAPLYIAVTDLKGRRRSKSLSNPEACRTLVKGHKDYPEFKVNGEAEVQAQRARALLKRFEEEEKRQVAQRPYPLQLAHWLGKCKTDKNPRR